MIFFLCLTVGLLFLYLGHGHMGQTVPVNKSLTEIPSGSDVKGDLLFVYLTVIMVYLFFLFSYLYLLLACTASLGLAIL